jgi:outer membrane protein OmpA-like peptidoglycan-associated protein
MFSTMATATRPRHPISAIAVAASALLFAFSLGGCPNKKPKTPLCDGDEDCQDGMVCINKECKPCTEDSQCDGGACVAGKCEDKGECSTDTDCPDGKVCKSGACMSCANDGECGPGGKCSAGACERPTKCTKDEECADDEDCIDGFCKNPGAPTGGSASCNLTTVYFAFDDSSIQATERDHLDANAACIEKNPERSVYLMGHTDSSGTDEYNIALSERRAQSVADYMSRLGTDPAKISVVPKGETELTGMGDDKDRRVEFQWR